MDNNSENEHNERRNSNTEYLPTKCRITKPPPPKPATNPLQFVKVAPCPLFQKAHEQIKKVEEIKKERKEIREEAEDWQQNLDNWKSSRRKRQEHIIERVVEVKKLEQEEQERNRRKSKTFNEMIEDRSRGRHKFSIPIFDDDSNDLSDYGIGSSSSKTNSVKDFDTDDSSSLLDEKDHRLLESPCNNKENSNQSQSEDETTSKVDKTKNQQQEFKTKLETNKYNDKQETIEQYTYEGAIQDYRTRIRSKIHVDESIFTKSQDYNSKSKEYNEAQSALPKGEIYKRKELFELDKQIDINTCETNNTTRRLSEDFVNTQSIKQRLQSLEKCVETPIKSIDKYDMSLVKQRLQNFNKQNDNNNVNKNNPPKISNYLLDKKNDINNKNTNQTEIEWKKKDITSERCSSPETDLYMDKLNTFSKDLDNLMYGKTGNINNILEDYVINQNYPPSTSSTELTCLSSDREDSGIHTADVSCSVSQADEPAEDFVTTTTNITNNNDNSIETKDNQNNSTNIPESKETIDIVNNNNNIDCNVIKETENLLHNLREDSSNNFIKKPPVIYENIQFNNQTPIEFIGDIDPLAPPKIIEPPNKPPPPPPPIDDDNNNGDGDDNNINNNNNNNKIDNNIQRMNSTKRIKREMYIKRSSFLGLDETLNNDEIDTIININKPPDVTKFLQKEQKLEKTLYKKTQEDNRVGLLSKVSSHDSGLEIDRGRLSSDTWCSSIGDSNTPSPERQDSEQMNSITSEEDEIMKKEREIIEMVEKEEKSRDNIEYKNFNDRNQQDGSNVKYLENCYNTETSNYLDDQDSEVLKVEQELRMLEREELERQRDVRLFESNRKVYLQNNRRSLDNILDEIYPVYQDGVNYRKSVPELQHIPLEYRKSLPDVPNIYNIYTENRNLPDVDLQYRKSMPDIQNAYKKCDYRQTLNDNNVKLPLEHRKSMPDVSVKSPPPIKRQPIMPGKPLRPLTKEQKERFFMMNNNTNLNDTTLRTNKQPLTRNSLQALSAVPKSRHLQPNNWIHPRNETKNYNQHWLYQEAELRRIAEQQKNTTTNRNNQQRPRQEKHLPDSIIQSLTQRVQNRNDLNDRNPPPIRSPNRQNQSGHALPMPYSTQMTTDESQDRILSVSGKKKCSYCNNELGRGAAMIIESLCLFYHMECFKCCVCHMQLSDGLMGTDVRVRNQKLHCHNCYSSDDGVKFSCV